MLLGSALTGVSCRKRGRTPEPDEAPKVAYFFAATAACCMAGDVAGAGLRSTIAYGSTLDRLPARSSAREEPASLSRPVVLRVTVVAQRPRRLHVPCVALVPRPVLGLWRAFVSCGPDAVSPQREDPEAILVNGPLSVLRDAVVSHEQVLINLRNNRKLLARVKVTAAPIVFANLRATDMARQ